MNSSTEGIWLGCIGICEEETFHKVIHQCHREWRKRKSKIITDTKIEDGELEHYEGDSEAEDSIIQNSQQVLDNYKTQYDVIYTKTSQIIQCEKCQYFSYREFEINEEKDKKYNEEIFPNRYLKEWKSVIYPNVPSNILDVYNDALKSFNKNLKIFCAIGLRMTVEVVCKHLNILEGKAYKSGRYVQANSLEGKINGLYENNIIGKDLADTLHANRIIGNDAAHEMIIPEDKHLSSARKIVDYTLRVIFEPKEIDDVKKEFDELINDIERTQQRQRFYRPPP